MYETMKGIGKDFGSTTVIYPIDPGEKQKAVLKVSAEYPLVSGAIMLGMTNDGFLGPESIDMFKIDKPMQLARPGATIGAVGPVAGSAPVPTDLAVDRRPVTAQTSGESLLLICSSHGIPDIAVALDCDLRSAPNDRCWDIASVTYCSPSAFPVTIRPIRSPSRCKRHPGLLNVDRPALPHRHSRIERWRPTTCQTQPAGRAAEPTERVQSICRCGDRAST